MDNQAKPRVTMYAEIATTKDGRDITRGYIGDQWYLQPQDKVLLYQAGGNYEVYEDILRDDRVKSALSQRRSAVVSRETLVAPGGTRRRDRMAADFIRETIEHIRWDTLTERMHYGIFYGYSVAEALYVRDGAHVALDGLRVRNRRRFVFDQDFEPRLLTTHNAQGEPLPAKKFWTFATGADNDDEPYGRGLGHYLYWPVWFKKNQTKFWLVFLEKFGAPTAVGKYHKSASDIEKERLYQALRSVHNDSGISIPDDMVIELLEARRSGTVGYDAFYDKMNDAISTIILSQTMTTSDGSSLSQAQVHMEVRDEIVRSDACLICDSFSRTVATWLTEWNFPGAAVPHVNRVIESPDALKSLADRDKIIVDMGHALTADYVEETYGVVVDRERRLQPTPTADPAGGPETGAAFAEGDGPFSLLAEQAREDIGPKIDALVARVAEALDDAGSLTALRDWLDHDAVSVLSVDSLVESLGQLLALGFLTGWSDSADRSVAFAETETARLPFDEQIAFFRRKHNFPTNTWTDFWQSQHDVGFVVAGGTKTELLDDFRTAVDSAIAKGTTLGQFREDFDAIVAKHGWSYNGGRDWRSRVIYETNLRTSYAAGRWEQLQAVKKQRPFWRYRHSGAAANPRPEHVAWDGLILSADDPWWKTHFPPNGWGCGCYIESLSQRDMDKLGKTGPDPTPAVNTRKWVDKHTGEIRQVPHGIDPGWAYAPGRTSTLREAVRQRITHSAQQSTRLAAIGVAGMLSNPRALNKLTELWRDWRRQDAVVGGNALEIGALGPAVVDALTQRGIRLEVATVTITRRDLAHTVRDTKRRRGQSLDEADLDRLPAIIAQPEAVLFDTQDSALLYVFSPAGGRDGKGKVVIRVNYRDRLTFAGQLPKTLRTNSVRTAGYVAQGDLTQRRYEVLEGAVE